MTYPIHRPTKYALRDADPTVLGNLVLRAIRSGEVFVATPDELDLHTLRIGLLEPTPPRYSPPEREDRASILPWLTAAVL